MHSFWQKGLKSLKRFLSLLLHFLTSETVTINDWLLIESEDILETENQITPGTNVQSLISSLSIGHAVWLQNMMQFDFSVQETIGIGITKVWQNRNYLHCLSNFHRAFLGCASLSKVLGSVFLAPFLPLCSHRKSNSCKHGSVATEP